ncbi:HigA family addiction module antitoxin [Emticicia sp. 17c]|uniref:HigA family addiction module antitoxin n=1 Tax=Emticicia sp. 17c TaxID=3127704 RepID=UPI00301CAD4F
MKTSINLQTPGQYIRENILQPRKISVTEAAKILGIGRPALSNFLNGNSTLSVDMASRIERAFAISAQILHDMQVTFDLSQAKVKGTPSNTNIYVPPFLDILASEIEQWASSIKARTRLAVFLRTLIHSSGIVPSKVNFNGNDNGERPGWDGFIIASEGTPWIPEGVSGWEFGCNQDIKTKADGDYIKSIKANNKSERESITFVFVTPHKWSGKDNWIKENNAKGQWKDVRAYDASDLEQWVSQSIAGQTWFANEIKRTLSLGTRSLDKCWDDWARVSEPSLIGSLFKTPIDNSRTLIISKLTKTPKEPIIITADSTEEAVAFLAELFNDSTEDLTKFRDKVVVFDQPGVLPQLAAGSSNFIAVVTNREVERELAIYSRQIHCIIVYPRNSINTDAHVKLEPLNYESFHSSLEEMGYTDDERTRLENESGRSLTVLRRRLSNIPAIRNPDWVTDKSTSAKLVPFLFAGAWNSTNQCDQIILSSLAKETPYDDLEKQVQEINQLNDSPVWSTGSYRGVVSKIDLLFAISGTITQTELKTYFDVAELVLSEDNPSLDLPEKQRIFAKIFGKTREISGPLRNGICETLVLLAVHGNSLFLNRLGINVEVLASKLVEDLLYEPLTTRKLEAHDRDLPTYAEVAPDTFLKILEKDLKTFAPATIGLMKPAESDFFGGGCSRTGLLWALENLAWSPITLTRAALILARLAEVKIDDNWANKPIASLKAIFLCWMPQTAANASKRISVLNSIIKDYPKIGWEICMEQFGRLQQSGSYSNKPRWRNDAQGYGAPIKTNKEMYEFTDKVVEIVLHWKNHDKTTIGDLVERLHDLREEEQEVIWTIVKDWAITASDLDKAWIREKIRVNFMSRKMISRNEHGQINQSIVAANAAYEALEPKNIINKFEWLFRQSWVEESYDEINNGDNDYRKRAERIDQIRSKALQDIYNERGTDGILELSELGKAPFEIGTLMTKNILSSQGTLDFILKVVGSEEKATTWAYESLVKGTLRSIIDNNKRTEILIKAKEFLSEENFIRLLRFAPFCEATWYLVNKLNESLQQIYWSSVSPDWWHYDEQDPNEVVEKLLVVNRPRAAFSYVHYIFEKIRPALLYRLMNALVNKSNEIDGTYQFQHYEIEKAFEFLENSDSFSFEQMAVLEFAYIDIIALRRGNSGTRGIPNLEKYIELHPEFFAQVVAWVYRRKDGETDPDEIKLDDPGQVQYRAQRGYKLIDALQHIPGHNEIGEVDTNHLLNWIKIYRNTCKELGRKDIGDLTLGGLLAKSPKGKDEIWPCEPIRDVLEQIKSDDISRGMVTGRYNSRGLHWRGEGGDQERQLAKMYSLWTQALEFSHPFVAASILNKLVQYYEDDALREDTEAGIRKRLK